MGNIFQAIEESKHKYVSAKRNPKDFTGDLEAASTEISKGICACKGICGSHTGPCRIQASANSKSCKTCLLAEKLQAKKKS